MVMLRDELAEIREPTARQRHSLRKLLDEREVPVHFEEVLRKRLNGGDLSRREAHEAITRLKGLPDKESAAC
jgi:hypothetical protein